MITKKQEEWINTLSDKNVIIVPYDNRSENLFQKVKNRIHKILGDEVTVEHCGASSLFISGQDEIDVSIVVIKELFREYILKLEKEFGPLKSRYPDRVRFKVSEEGKKIDLKIIDKNHSSYFNGKIFENYLRNNPKDLERYKILKEYLNGKTTKEYYRGKTEFINEILEKAGQKMLIL